MTATVRVGLLGFGTVGRAFLSLLDARREALREEAGVDVAVALVGVRGADAKRASWIAGRPEADAPRFTEDLAAVVASPGVDLVVELLGGLEPARKLILAAFAAGKDVVTANKLLLATHGESVAAAARRAGRGLGLEASVAGGIPVLRALRESFAGDAVTAVGGILNGTCNFVLTEMEASGRSYAQVLAEAQKLGYAEADPESDVGGADAAYKLVLLARMAFGQAIGVEGVPRQGITNVQACDFVYAKLLGRTLRQLALARRLPDGRVAASVRTHLVSNDSLLAKVTGPFNAALVTLERGGEFVLHGRGAGGDPTATAVLGDVVDLARSGPRAALPPLGRAGFGPFRAAGPAENVSAWYLRFVVHDRPGILAEIATELARSGVNIDAVYQAPWDDKAALPFAVTLEAAPESRVNEALLRIGTLGFHAVAPAAFPMAP